MFYYKLVYTVASVDTQCIYSNLESERYISRVLGRKVRLFYDPHWQATVQVTCRVRFCPTALADQTRWYASYMGPGDWDTLLGWGKSVAYKVAFTNTSL